MKKVVRVLAIDGGGVRGIIPAIILTEIEKRTGKKISEIFDLVSGTSTGGIIALGLVAPDAEGKPKFSANDILSFYERMIPLVFKRSFLRKAFSFIDFLKPKYSPQTMEDELKRLVGDSKLSDSITDVLIPAYEIETRTARFFKSQKVKNSTQNDYYMRDVARATSAAPSFFPPAKISSLEGVETLYCVDGSTFANDPAMCAYAEAKNMYPEMESIILVSIGTGNYNEPISYTKAKMWGIALWTLPILSILFDGMPDTVEYQLKKILNIQAGKQQYFFRFQEDIAKVSDALDNASQKNLKALKVLAQKTIEEKSTLIDEMCRILLDPTLK